jgi:hypothetical protein
MSGVAPSGILHGKLVPKGRSASITDVVALDCEMVGVGPGGRRDALAWVCVVRYCRGMVGVANIYLTMYRKVVHVDGVYACARCREWLHC